MVYDVTPLSSYVTSNILVLIIMQPNRKLECAVVAMSEWLAIASYSGTIKIIYLEGKYPDFRWQKYFLFRL